MTYQSEVLADAPLAYYRLGEASGTAMNDSSGNSRGGSYASTVTLGTPGLIPGDADTAVTFTGSGYGNVPGASWLSPTAFTVEAIIKPSALPASGQQATIAARYVSGAADWWFFVDSTGVLYFCTYSGGFQNIGTTAGTIAAGSTYHVAATWASGTATIYVNGTQVKTGATARSTFGVPPLQIGASQDGATLFYGVIDEVAYYASVLSATRIQAHHTAAAGDPTRSLTIAATAPAATGSLTAHYDAPPLSVSLAGAAPAAAGALSLTSPIPVTITATAPAATAQLDLDTKTRQVASSGAFPVVSWTADWEPVVVPTPTHLKRGHDYVKTHVTSGKTTVDSFGRVSFANEPTVIEAKADRGRIIVDGVDLTYFRGIKTPIPGYLLTQPFEYGATSITFPQVSPVLESGSFGTGELSWVRHNAEVKIQRVDPATNNVTSTSYEGVVNGIEGDGATLILEVGGELSDRASARDKQPPLMRLEKDLGLWVYDTLWPLGIRSTPRLGPTTGIEITASGGMTELDWLNRLCSMSTNKAGEQWTVMKVPGKPKLWEFRKKDTTTIHATVYFDDARIVPSLKRDLLEEPVDFYATGVRKDGLEIRGDVYPGLIQGKTPAYPMAGGADMPPGTTDADTTTGSGVSAMLWRLIGMGYLARVDAEVGVYDQDVADAIEDLQDEADLPQTGTMNPATWDALYDLSVTGYSIHQSEILPMVQKPSARDWFRTASGAKIRRNPTFRARDVRPTRAVDFGSGVKGEQQMRRWLRREMNRGNGKNWTGTVRFNGYGLIRGEHNPGDPTPTSADVMPFYELRPGMNVWAPRWDGGTLFHVTGAQPDDEPEAGTPWGGTATFDTKYRDHLTVAEIIERNRDSRFDPARAFLAQRRSSMPHDQFGTWSKVGGVLFDEVSLTGGTWDGNVFPVVAGQEGEVRKLAMQLNPATEWVMAIFGKGGKGAIEGMLNAQVGDPFTDAGRKAWQSDAVRKKLDERVLLYINGQASQPCGYSPGQKTGDDGKATGDPITGKHEDAASFPYYGFDEPVMWVAIFPKAACSINRGRIMWDQQQAGQ